MHLELLCDLPQSIRPLWSSTVLTLDELSLDKVTSKACAEEFSLTSTQHADGVTVSPAPPPWLMAGPGFAVGHSVAVSVPVSYF